MRELEQLLKAAANRRRLGILAYLKRRRRASVGQLASHLKLSIRTTSKHLGVLRAAGLVESEQVSTYVFYSLAWPLPAVIQAVVKQV